MAKTTLKEGEYTFDASAKTITLAAPYDALDQAQIVSIFNVTTHDQMFDIKNRKYSLSLSGAVITHTYDNTQHSDTDKLQIIVDTELDFTDIDVVIFENNTIINDEMGVSDWISIEGIGALNLYISSVLSFAWYVQLTDDPSANPDGYELCDSSGTIVSYTTAAQSKCIPITNIKASKMRILAKNNGATPEAPYCGVK